MYDIAGGQESISILLCLSLKEETSHIRHYGKTREQTVLYPRSDCNQISLKSQYIQPLCSQTRSDGTDQDNQEIDTAGSFGRVSTLFGASENSERMPFVQQELSGNVIGPSHHLADLDIFPNINAPKDDQCTASYYLDGYSKRWQTLLLENMDRRLHIERKPKQYDFSDDV